jgi:hypothetical protein
MPAYLFDVLCRNRGVRITRPSDIVGPAYRSRIWPTVVSGIQKSAKMSCPYNQGGILPSMERYQVDRVHSGGLPTLTVHKYNPYLTEARSQCRKYKVQGYGVPSRAIREKVKGLCLRQQVLFGV